MRVVRLTIGGLLAVSLSMVFPMAAGASNPWVRVAVPNPGSDRTVLLSVSCNSATTCTSVGYYDNNTGHHPLVMSTTDGSTWVRIQVPEPSPVTQLDDVSCTSPTECTAVGGYAVAAGPSSFTTRALVLRTTDGAAWFQKPAPKPGLSELLSVSCITAVRCRAVGMAGNATLIARTTDGLKWTRQSSPNVGTGPNELRSVDCTNNTHCTAVGAYHLTASNTAHDRTLVLHTTNARDWTVVASPNPAPSQSDSPLREVSCTGPLTCTAVGAVVPAPAGVHRAFILRMSDGATWSRSPTPAATGDVILEGVDCTTATTCTAAGYEQDASGLATLRLLRTSDGATWSSPDPSAERLGRVSSAVSCPTEVACVAVGTFNTTGNPDDNPLRALVMKES